MTDAREKLGAAIYTARNSNGMVPFGQRDGAHKLISARTYARDAVQDIIDLIEDGTDPGSLSPTPADDVAAAIRDANGGEGNG